MVSRVIPVEVFDLVIFGATGDLANRKILPGLYRRYLSGQIPPECRIIGAARSAMDVPEFRNMVRAAIADTPGAAWGLARYAEARIAPLRSGDAIDQEARATRSRAARRRGRCSRWWRATVMASRPK